MMKVYSNNVSKKVVDLVVSEVQAKKEYSNFSESYILKYLEHLLKKNKKLLELLSSDDVELSSLKKKKIFQGLIRDIRDKVRRIYGVYITKKYSKREDLLEASDIDGLLQLHMSTKERFDYYDEVYSKLIELCGKPKSILDLACGFNPLVQGKFGKVLYNCSDISEKDVAFLKKCYTKFGFKGDVFRADLSEENEHKKLDKYDCDWCLLFKALDPVEESNQDISYKLIESINCKWIIVSFPTVTVSNKKMRNPTRSWFEKLLKRKELEYSTFEIENELFYVVKNER